MTTVLAAAKRGRPIDDEKLEHVLVVATEEFAKRGYRAVTMREVARLADVSTRTLYNRFEDKLSLFTACIDTGAGAFPSLVLSHDGDIRDQLVGFVSAVNSHLSMEPNLHMGMLVYRDGPDFPEIRRAAKQNQETYLLRPLARFLRAVGLENSKDDKKAIVFLNMATSEWQRRIVFGDPPLNSAEIAAHAELVTDLFLNGA